MKYLVELDQDVDGVFAHCASLNNPWAGPLLYLVQDTAVMYAANHPEKEFPYTVTVVVEPWVEGN